MRGKELAVDEALGLLKTLPFEDLGFARVDTHRELRMGFPEVVFRQGKTVEQVVGIVEVLSRDNSTIMATRAPAEVYQAIRTVCENAVYHDSARVVVAGRKREPKGEGKVLVVSAGTADLPVAEEAAVVCETMGNKVERLYDSGVAGVNRLLSDVKLLDQARVIIVVAGMDGALPSIVGGLVDKPVIAVPTSVGYGASFDGLAALLTMLNSCAPGVVVVNIDNGFGAGYFASIINQMGDKQ